MSTLSTLAPGITQSDVVIRAALEYGFADLRANPWLVQWVFSSLAQDPLTKDQYGEAQIDSAVKWFMSTNVPILMAFTTDGPPPLPCVSIALMSSNEIENTLADVHYDTSEEFTEAEMPWPVLAGPFRSVSYDASTGKLSFSDTNQFVLSVGQMVVDSAGRAFPILTAQEGNAKHCYIKKGIMTELAGLTIRAPKASYRIRLESAIFDEQYLIGCHVKGSPVELIYLHSIVKFCLLRYREVCLERRGFGESKITSTDLRKNPSFEQLGIAEPVYSRYIQIEGNTRDYWPKDLSQTIHSTSFHFNMEANGQTVNMDVDAGGLDTADPVSGVAKHQSNHIRLGPTPAYYHRTHDLEEKIDSLQDLVEQLIARMGAAGL